MDGKDKIIEKILSDADNYRLNVLNKADRDYDLLVGAVKKEVEEELTKEEAFLNDEESKALKRKKVVADLDGKKLYLSKKTEAVNQVFLRALDKLCNLEKSAYTPVIYRLIKENAAKNATVVLSKNSPVSAKEVLELDISKDLSLSVKENGNFRGGIVIESKVSDINLSFEAIIGDLKEKYETAIAEKLFG